MDSLSFCLRDRGFPFTPSAPRHWASPERITCEYLVMQNLWNWFYSSKANPASCNFISVLFFQTFAFSWCQRQNTDLHRNIMLSVVAQFWLWQYFFESVFSVFSVSWGSCHIRDCIQLFFWIKSRHIWRFVTSVWFHLRTQAKPLQATRST